MTRRSVQEPELEITQIGCAVPGQAGPGRVGTETKNVTDSNSQCAQEIRLWEGGGYPPLTPTRANPHTPSHHVEYILYSLFITPSKASGSAMTIHLWTPRKNRYGQTGLRPHDGRPDGGLWHILPDFGHKSGFPPPPPPPPPPRNLNSLIRSPEGEALCWVAALATIFWPE